MDLESLVNDPNGARLLLLLKENCERLLLEREQRLNIANVTPTEQTPIAETAVIAEPVPIVETTLIAEQNPIADTTLIAEPVPSAETTVIAEPVPIVETNLIAEPVPSAETDVIAEPVPIAQTTLIAEPDPIADTPAEPIAETTLIAGPDPIAETTLIAESKSAAAQSELENETTSEINLGQIESDRAMAFAEYEEEVELTVLELHKAYLERGQEIEQLQQKVAQNDHNKAALIDRYEQLMAERAKDLDALQARCGALEKEKSDRQAVLAKYKSTDLVQTLVQLDRALEEERESTKRLSDSYAKQLKDAKLTENRLRSDLAAVRSDLAAASAQRTYHYERHDRYDASPNNRGQYYYNNSYGLRYDKLRL